VALVALERRSVIGAVTAECLGYESFLQRVPADMADAVKSKTPRFDFHLIGFIRTVAVSENMRGRGVGTKLVKAAVKRLHKLGATSIVTIGWADRDGCHIAGLVTALGFTEIATFRDFWKADSIAKEYSCPTCGNPCRCQANLFLLAGADAT
jgi:GNAT superfamily N-acetyltransferase